MKKQSTAWLLRGTSVLCLALCLASGYAAGKSIWEQKKAEALYHALANIVMEATVSTSLPELGMDRSQNIKEADIKNKKSPKAASKSLKEEAYQLLYKQNPDFSAWLRIEDTKINYPVMTSLEKDYYLYRDFKKQDSRYGTPYIDPECGFQDLWTVIIYGHHMKDGSMFAGLSEYKKPLFYKEHSKVQIDYFTGQKLKETVYTVFAVILIEDAGDMEYPFYEAAKALEKGDQTRYTEYIRQIKKYALYDTGVTPKYKDQLLLLSTCDYTGTDGRLLVVAALDTL